MVSSYLLLKTSFVNNSSAQGVLYAFMYLNDGIIDFSKSRYLPVKRFEAELGINVTDVEIFKGLYRILSFEIEKNFEIQGDGSPADVTYINSTSNLPSTFFYVDILVCTFMVEYSGCKPCCVNCIFM